MQTMPKELDARLVSKIVWLPAVHPGFAFDLRCPPVQSLKDASDPKNSYLNTHATVKGAYSLEIFFIPFPSLCYTIFKLGR